MSWKLIGVGLWVLFLAFVVVVGIAHTYNERHR